MFSKFLLGTIKVDEEAKQILGRTPLDLLSRHAVCEHGVATPRQIKQNLISLAEAGEISSIYFINPMIPQEGKVKITTAAGWGETRISISQPKKPTKRKKGCDDLPI